MFRVVFFLYIILQSALPVYSQQDSLGHPVEETVQHPRPVYRDTAAVLRWKARNDSIKAVQDSLKAIGDSLSMVWLKPPDPNRPNRFLDSLVELYRVKDLDFAAWAAKFPPKVNRDHEGKPRRKGEPWIFWFIILLLVVFAVLRRSFTKEISLIFEALFSSRTLNQINREEGLFSSWPFVILYVLLALVIGTFLYLCERHLHIDYSASGFQGLISLSLIVFLFFTLKVISLRVLAFIFNLKKVVGEYISVLFISYSAAGILFLPLTAAVSLTPSRFVEIYIYLGLLMTAFIFFWQFIRVGAAVLSEHRFPIVYLLLYICALEICPLIVLIKLLSI